MSRLLEDTLTQEEIDNIINMYNNNISLREIEKQVHHGRRSIAFMLERLNVKTTVGNHYKPNSFDYDFFEKVDNELKAYWLGFLYADGSIQTNDYGEQSFKLSLQKSDEEILKKFKEDLHSTYNIRYDESRNKINPNSQVQAIYECRSQKTVDDLKKLGCVERKSLILEFPTEEQVPNEFIYDFIRGYFDGDGSISSYTNKNYVDYHISIVGTENFIKKLYSVVEMGSIFPDKRKTNSWYLSINGNHQVMKFYHLLYDNSTRYLQRKYLKFQELLNKYNESQGTIV